jgi:hypothetical protein
LRVKINKPIVNRNNTILLSTVLEDHNKRELPDMVAQPPIQKNRAKFFEKERGFNIENKHMPSLKKMNL